MNAKPDSQYNILIVRLSAIGDIFFCTSLLRVLRERYPDCRITWLTEPMGATILDGHPGLDEVISIPRREWTRDFKAGRWIRMLRSMDGIKQRLRDKHYDLVIDPQGLLKSGIWAKISSSDFRIGINAREGSDFLYDEVLQVQAVDRPQMLQEYRLLSERLGGRRDDVRMYLEFKDNCRTEAEQFLEEEGISDPVVFCPFTTRPQKHWFVSDWALLGDMVHEAGLGPVVILGGPGDGAGAEEIAGQMTGPCVIAAGESRPIGFALAMLSKARAVVGVDTGLTHAGIGLERPTIGLFGSTKPYLETGNPRARILYTAMDCSPCHRRPTCDGRFDCMRAHTPEIVMENLIQLTQESASLS